jgi:hypothetical protein
LANKFDRQRRVDPDSLGTTSKVYTPSAAELPKETKAVYFDASCSFDYVNPDTSAVAGHPAAAGTSSCWRANTLYSI